MNNKETLEYKEAVEYAKKLVGRVLKEIEESEDVRTIVLNAYKKDDEYYMWVE